MENGGKTGTFFHDEEDQRFCRGLIFFF